MTPHEVVEHALAALVQGDIPNHLHYLADDVIWKLNENAAEQGKSGYQQLITAMTRNQDEMIVGFQLDGDHLDGGPPDTVARPSWSEGVYGARGERLPRHGWRHQGASGDRPGRVE